jgi:hypothetical protein
MFPAYGRWLDVLGGTGSDWAGRYSAPIEPRNFSRSAGHAREPGGVRVGRHQ